MTLSRNLPRRASPQHQSLFHERDLPGNFFSENGGLTTVRRIPTPVQIRPARSVDKAALKALDEVAREEPSRQEYIDRAVESEQCFVALDDSEPVGYAVLSYQFYNNGWVDMLYVGRDSRRRGIGVALLTHLAQSCTTPKLFASTNQSNKPMQALFEKAGFRSSGVIHNLDVGDPELVYFKALDRDAV
jgi:ribosomal protein S18 acetylase RimI-like enzyme